MTRECIILAILTIIFITKNSNAVSYGNVSEKSHASGHEKTIYKCCPFGEYVGIRRRCVRYNETLAFPNTEVYDGNMQKTGKSVEEVFSLVPGKFEDIQFKKNALMSSLIEKLGFNLYVVETGVLTIEMPNMYERWWQIPNGNFCVDYQFKANKKFKSERIWAIMPGDRFEESNVYFTYASLVSCFFMLLVLIVYFLLPELQNLSGLILMAYVASLFLAFLLLSIIQITQHTVIACIGLTLGIYYFFIASFCWMSVMSYDIWWTFRGYAKARPIQRRGERFKFLMYCLYAWGLPLAMTIVLAILNTVDMSHMPWFVTPHVPNLGCFLVGGIKLLYLYIPMLILIICNWMFYLMTAFNIWRLSRGTALPDSAAAENPQAHRTNRHRFMVYLQLSVVMGLNWLLEIVSYLYPGYNIWYITDAYNVLTGLAIFLIFVCKKKVYRMLCKRYRQLRDPKMSRTQTMTSISTRTLNSQSRDELEIMNCIKT